MMLSKIFGFFGTKGQKGEKWGVNSNHQTTKLPNHQTILATKNTKVAKDGRMPMDAANGLTVKRSNGQTGLRGRRFAAPWARAAAVAAVAGGMWLGGGLTSAWGAFWDSWFGGEKGKTVEAVEAVETVADGTATAEPAGAMGRGARAISASDYTGTGTFKPLTQLLDDMEGFYVIAYGTGITMPAYTSGNNIPKCTGFTQNGSGNYVNPPTTNVWMVVTNASGGYNIRSVGGTLPWLYSASSSKNYLKGTSTCGAGATYRWNFAYSSGWTIKNAGNTSYGIRYNSGSSLFSQYTSGQNAITLYRLEASGVAPTLSSSSGSATIDVGDGDSVDISALVTAGTTPITYTVTSITTPSGVTLTENDDYTLTSGELLFYPPSAGEYVFTVTVANGITPNATYTWTVTATEAAAEYTWAGTGSGWWLRGNTGGLDWSTGKQMVTDANFGGGDYSRVTLNSASGTVEYKWFGDSSYWIGYYDGCANPAKNTVYVPGGGSWQGNNFSSSFFTSGKYYTFRGKFYANPENAGERMNDFVIMETTGAPTEFVSAGSGNPSGTAAAAAQTVSVTLNHDLNSEETVYVRYKAGSAAWATVALNSGSGTTRSGTIPVQTVGTTVEYYFLTTTVGKSTLDANADLCTLHGLKNGANNWSYTVAAASVTASAVSGSALTATHPNASSGYQSFTVSGSRLTGALTVTAPSGFAVCSTSGGTYGNTVTLTPSGTTLSSTTVYLKLAANTASGSHSDNVTISGGGLTANVTVAVSGTVVPAALTLGAAAGATPGTVTLTVSGAETGASVNVRRYTTSAAASSDTTGTGGTKVTAVNANGTFTDSGLDGCTTYYYKGWQSKGGQTSAATEVKSAKTALAAPDVWSTADDGSITLNWPPVKGAVNYTVEIATDDTFAAASGGTATDTITGTFTGQSSYGEWTGKTGDSGAVYAGYSTTGTGSYSGDFQMNNSSSRSCGLVSTANPGSSATVDSIKITWNGGSRSIEVYGKNTAYSAYSDLYDNDAKGTLITTIESSSSGVNVDLTASGVTKYKYIGLKPSGNNAVYLSIDITWATGGGSGGTMMANYPVTVSQVAAGVTNVTHSLSGLTNEVTYSYRVTANGGESCETTSSIGHEEPTAATPTMGVTVGGSGVAYDGTVAFGNVGVGSPQTKTFTVANTGSGTLTLGTVGVTAGQGFTVTGPESGSVAGSGSTTFTVTFTPTAEMIGAGQKSATVSFTHNDGEKTTPYRFTVTASATGGILAVDESAGGLAFGNTPLDSPKTETVTIRNTGNVALTVGSVAVSGTGFSLVSAWSSQSIAAGGSATVSVRFAPASAGGKSGTLMVTASGAASGSPATVALTGTGINETTGNIWIKPLTTGNQGTKTVGDTMGEYFLNFEIGQSSWNKSEVGIGLSTGTVWGDFDWGDATYYEPGESSGNKRVRRDLSGFQFTQAGQYNVIYAAKNAAGDNSTVRCAGDWVNYTTWLPTDFGATYFTVEAVPDPTVTSATAGYETVALRWSLDAASHPVMIVRYTGATPTVTAPTPGEHYESGATIGAGTVVYREWAGTSVDTAVAQGTTYTYVLYSVNNGYYSAGAQTTVTSSSVSTPSVTVTDAGSGTLTGGDSGVTYVVARNTTGTFDTNPTGSGPNQGGTLGTGANAATVVYRGTAATFTDTTVVGCNTYYYKVWAKAASEDAWSAGSGVANATMATPAAPVLNALSSVTYQGFTASWAAVPGAATYRVDVAKSFGGTVTETFNNADLGTGTVSQYLNRNITGGEMGAWTATQCRIDQTTIDGKAPTIGAGGTLVSSPLANGCTAVSFQYAWPFTESGSVTIKLYDDDVEVGTETISTASSGTATFSDLNIAAGSVVKFENTATSNKRMVMDNITFTSTPDYVSGWENADVSSLMTESAGVVSVDVDGLAEDTTYYVRVKAQGNSSSCTSVWSNVQSAKTGRDDSVTDVEISGVDAAGAAGSNVGTGSVLAGGTVLLQGTKLVVASGSVNPVLTGVSFGTTGSATGSDIGMFRVRIGTTAAYGGNETVFGTATGAAAGTQSVSGTATLTAGTTYYVWIEAATLAGATAGNGVAVSALTGDSFTTTGARKTGSSAAAGTQTIYGAPTVSLTAGASGSAKITGTVSGLASGATVELRRYESAAAASGDTSGTGGTAVTVTEGAFEATGLEACRPYWFKARQTLNGYTGAWGAVATATAPGLTAPANLGATPTTTGAALSWDAVAGALGYSVSVWHYVGGGGKSTATYTVDGKTSVTTSGTLPTGAGQTFSSTYNTVGQMTSGNSQTLTLTGFGGVRITGLTLSMKSNASGGAGTLTLQVGENDAVTVASGAFNSSAWNGDWSTSYVDVVKTLDSPVMVDDGESVVIQITASANSLYCLGYSVKYETGTPAYDVLAGVPASGVTFTPGTGASLASATVGGLDPNSEYQWSVAATGFEGCPGDGTTSSFTTLEVAGAPVIATPLTSAVEQLSGSITGTPGASMILKRYDTAEGAAAGAAGGSLGGVVVRTTEGAGASAGTWTFTDTGLDGCTTYYYKAWQVVTVDGVDYTSSGSDVVSGKTGMRQPSVTANGAGTQLTISCLAVPGATNYVVKITDTDGVWTSSSAGEAVLTEDFANFTGNGSADIGESLDSYTSSNNWFGSKVYTASGSAKLGSSSSSGFITTPRIAAMPYGGTVYFDLKTYGDSTSLGVEICYDDGDEDDDNDVWTNLKDFTPPSDWETFQVTLAPGSVDFWLSFGTSSKRAYIDNIRVVPNTAGSGGLVYEASVDEAPFERTKIGLQIATKYWYQVTAYGDGCEETTEGWTMTEHAALIEVNPRHYNFGTVTKGEAAKTATFTVRNRGDIDLTFTSLGLTQDGDAYSIIDPALAEQTAAIAGGGSRTYTVRFAPTNSGPRAATLSILCNATNAAAVDGQTYRKVEIPLTGVCYDPATADPTVYWLKVEDELGIEDTVTDHSMAMEADEPVLTVLTWHYNRSYRTLDRSAKAAKWTLYDPNGDVVVTTGGTRLENQFFTAVEDYVYDGKTCAKFSAPIPALGAGNAIRGTYHVKVKVYDSTGTYWTETTNFVPIETGWLFEDFTRADTEATGSGALENGWTAMASGGAVVGEAAIHADALELYGANGEFTGEAGRIAVARDMSDVGYATNPHDFEGVGSWGFHFRTGAKTVGFANESTAGAFVLGSTKSTWLSADDDQVGYAVTMTNNAIQLVKFERSLLQGGTFTQLGGAEFSGTQGKLLAVRVDFVPGQDEVDADEADDGVHHDAVPAKFRLYVKEVAATGGNPITECGTADKVLEYEFAAAETHDLKYAGMMWNHGVAQVSDKTGAMFDDIYLPHMTAQVEPMMFHVIDEDTEAPEFYGFSIGGAYAASTMYSEGLTGTGMVHDASGLLATSVEWALYVDEDNDGELGEAKDSGVMVLNPGGNGAATDVALSWHIDAGIIHSDWRTTNCVFEVTATDYDIDRAEDSLTGTARYTFTLCDTAPTAPAWATAEVDGAEMVVLRWARTAGAQYVVVRSDEEIGDNSSPQGRTETMAEGTTVAGWGKVVYNGTGDSHLTGTWTAREFIVAPGSTNYFAVYGMTGNGTTGYYFSAPTLPKAYQWTTSTTNTETGVVTVTDHTAVNGSGVPEAGSVMEGAWPLVTPKYEPGEGVDAFAYRTSVCAPDDENPQGKALLFNYETRPETGSGWGGPWGSGDGDAPDKWKVHDSSLLTGTTHYPAAVGNKLYWQDTSTSSADEAKLTRALAAENSGDFFVAGILNFQYGGNNKWVTISLVDAEGHDLVSFGKQGGDNGNDAAIMTMRSQSVFGDHTLKTVAGGSAYTMEQGHGHDYIVVGQLSRTDHKLRMWVYTGNQRIPELFSKKENDVEVSYATQPTAMNSVRADWEYDPSLTVPAVAGIRLCAGSTDDSGVELGHVYFDEIRFATTWPELFLFNDPEVYTYDFDKPVSATPSGIMVGTDAEGHRLWQISDGALAHGNVGLNAQFGLYHRTGIQSASFRITDDKGTNLLGVASSTGGHTTTEPAANVPLTGRVTLTGTQGQTYSDWKTPTGGAMNVAIPTNWISLESNYVVEVTLTSTGGREATVTAASETGGAGADDLFFGEYGEGSYWDKYIELYNGTGHDIDLYDYYIFRPKKEQDWSDYSSLIPNDSDPFARLATSAGTTILHHKETIVLLNYVNQSQTGGYTIKLTNDVSGEVTTISQSFTAKNRLDALKAGLDASGANYLVMPNGVLDAGGQVPYLLIAASNFNESVVTAAKGKTAVELNWLDACGLASLVFTERSSERYIMSRKDTAQHLPRSKPLLIDPEEWDYRDWGWPKSTWYVDDFNADLDETATLDPTRAKYTNFVATAGQYDRNIGLGGNMEFKVFDDDIEAPTLMSGGLRVRKANGDLEEEYRAVSAGDRTYVMGGWSFTNYPSGKTVDQLTLEDYKWITGMWEYGITTNGSLSWSPELGGRDLAGYTNVFEVKATGCGQSNVEFDGIHQVQRGNMVARTRNAGGGEVWLGFDLDVAQLTEGVLAFGYAGGSQGFKNAYVAWSTTGEEGSFTMSKEWNFDPNSGGPQVWSEYSRSLSDADPAIPASAGHLWFRIYLSGSGGLAGTFRLDNIRVEGAPNVVKVTDAEICDRGMQFEVHVKDEASGLDAGSTGRQSSDDGKAYFDCGLGTVDKWRTVALTSGGKAESTISWTAAAQSDGRWNPVTTGWGALMAQNWYTQTQEGKGKLRVQVPDADDDRVGDQTMLQSDFGMLMVTDDDELPPVLEMTTMKPRQEGTMAEWLLTEKTPVPSETMVGLSVGALGLNTTAGKTTKPGYSERSRSETGMDVPTYAVNQSGWQAGSKYWTVTLSNTTAGAGTITKVSFWSKVGSDLAPKGYEVRYGGVTAGMTGEEAEDTWAGSLLTSGDAWVKEGSEEEGSPLNTWVLYEKDVDIPLAASGTSGDAVELRLYATGADPKGIGAKWFLWDLKIEGTITSSGGEDGYTYVTDAELADGASLTMSGSVYDAGSGLGATPTYSLTNSATGQAVASGDITFTTPGTALSARTTADAGTFSQNIAVDALGYGAIRLVEYKGMVHAEDGDNDRNSAADKSGTNYDSLELDGQFAFTVIDQDLVGPSAPTNVTVNGTAVPNAAPTRNNVTWTNKPEFLISFDVAEDVTPTEAELKDADWLAAHGVAAASVKKASLQTGAAGVGEYRVALATDAVSLSNAPAFSVAATNGALANYGFERYADTSWANPDSSSGINKGNNVGGSYPVAEGTNSYYLRAYTLGNNNPAASQIIPFAASESAQTLTVDLSLKIFKRASGSIVYAKFEFSADEESWTSAITDVGLNTGGDPQTNWLSKTMTTKTLTAPAGAKYLRFSLRSNSSGGANIDDVRLSVRVGAAPAAGTADRAMMRYVANAAAQGLNVKYLFAADADNNRVQDRRLGATATFYTAYDVTPPTAVQMNPESGASTEHVDDPTTQFDLTWNSSGVGPDDKDSPNGQAAGLTSNDALSPWYSYKIYYGAFDPEAWKGTTPASGASTTARLATRGGHVARATAYESLAAYINAEFIENEAYKTWNSVTRGSEVEDPSATGANYNTLGTKTTSSHRLYDLDFDQDYVVVIVGVDAAGNEGPATTTSWATNNTIKFAITQGVMRAEAAIPEEWKSGLNGADRAAALYWTASASDGQVKRTYDLIYRDAKSFNESSNNTWSLVGTVQSNWFVDAGALDHDAGRIRFYRAAYENRWKDKVEVSTSGRRGETEVVTQRPLMSEDVYAMTAVPLVQGMNYVSLHGFGVGNGETNTLGAIFGTDPGIWPVGTRLDVFAGNGYTAGTIGSNTASRTYVLQAKASGQTDWYREEGGNVIELSTHVVNPDIFRHGVAINLPPITEQMRDTVITNNGKTYNAIYWHPVLLVPTNNSLECVSKSTDIQNQETTGVVPVDFTMHVKAGNGRTGAAWNLCAVNLPVACHPSQLGLERFFMPASGMHLTPDCDILYAYDSVTKSLRPGSGMFLGHASTNSADTNLVWRSIIGNNPEVHGHPFYPNDMIVILSRGKEGGEQDWEWTYSPTDFYTAPTRWGGW